MNNAFPLLFLQPPASRPVSPLHLTGEEKAELWHAVQAICLSAAQLHSRWLPGSLSLPILSWQRYTKSTFLQVASRSKFTDLLLLWICVGLCESTSLKWQWVAGKGLAVKSCNCHLIFPEKLIFVKIWIFWLSCDLPKDWVFLTSDAASP